jgi:hypothetical protein
MGKRNKESENTKFTAIENHFTNTFFSGLYISSANMLNMAKKLEISIHMNPRELVLKNLLIEADKKNILQNFAILINELIDERVQQLHRLSLEYPDARVVIAALAQKANSSKAFLARELRGNPYE